MQFSLVLYLFSEHNIDFYSFYCFQYLCNKYISVFAQGTLGILPDTYLVPVSNGLLGDIVSMYQNRDIKYQNNLN